jgi:hypothetical protein
LHRGVKSDLHDLEAIFHAAINGYRLSKLTISEAYRSLQVISRPRHNLVKQRSRAMVQIRWLMHRAMPGYADLFGKGLYHGEIAMLGELKVTSRAEVQLSGVLVIANY